MNLDLLLHKNHQAKHPPLSPNPTAPTGIQSFSQNNVSSMKATRSIYLPAYPSIHFSLFSLKYQLLSFPGGSVVKDLAPSAGGRGSVADPGRPHMPRGTAGPVLWSLVATTAEPGRPSCSSPNALRPTLPSERSLCVSLERGPHLLQLKRSRSSSKDPAPP